MPSLDLVDETFVRAAPAAVAREVADPAQWRRWWPDLQLTVFMDRGRQGVRWNVSGALVGSAEIWLEETAGGVLVHYYLRAEPADAPIDTTTTRGARRAARIRDRRARAWKRHVWALQDRLESSP